MNELLSLLIIVFLVYLLQCIIWVSPRAIVFTLGVRGRGRRRYQGFVWNALDTAGLLANPFPPLPPLLVVQWPDFEITPDCIQFPNKEGATVSIPWKKLKITHSDSKLFCNGLPAFKGSDLQVAFYVELLGRLLQARHPHREQIIQEWVRKAMNTQTAARRIRIFAGKARWVRIIANVQFVFLFLLVPLGFEKFGTGILWRVILMLLAIDVALTLEFWTLHKSTFTQAQSQSQSKDQRFKSALTILLSPLSAIRACDAAARDLLSGYHPLAAAGALLPAEEFQQFAREQFRLCRFGNYSSERYQAILQKGMERAIRQQKLGPDELMRPPEPQSGCVVYCPRCLAQYTKQRTECTDCGYEGLELFDPLRPN